MAKRQTEKPRTSKRGRNSRLAAIYSKSRREFTAADLQKFTVEEKGVPQAIRRVWRCLTDDPVGFGEPLYRLPAMRLQVRHAAVGPLLIYFGIHDDRRGRHPG